MKVSEETLMRAGFTSRELGRIKKSHNAPVILWAKPLATWPDALLLLLSP